MKFGVRANGSSMKWISLGQLYEKKKKKKKIKNRPGTTLLKKISQK